MYILDYLAFEIVLRRPTPKEKIIAVLHGIPLSGMRERETARGKSGREEENGG